VKIGQGSGLINQTPTPNVVCGQPDLTLFIEFWDSLLRGCP